MRKQLLYGSVYLLSFLSASFLSCKKSVDNDSSQPANSFPMPAATPVNGSVSGRVIDENFAAVSAATVECAGVTTTTDVNGFFNITNATLDKYITTVTVSKPGYFKGYRSFSANASRNVVSIKLVPRVLAGTIDAGSGGSITLTNSTGINFQQNSIVIKSTGAAYGGTVNVYAAYIDPTASDISLTVPGSFMGTDASSLFVLKSTGMLAIEMESTAGEPLQLASNKPATVKLSIPSSLVSTTPNTINTWSLGEKGIWEKDGTAVKTGDHYEFFASHFSFWNCDQPSIAVLLNLHVQDQDGLNLVNSYVALTGTNNGTTYGLTDSSGNVSGMVPAGSPLILDIVHSPYQCQTPPLYTENIGPFTTNTSLTITASFSAQQGNPQLLSVSGTVNDCNGQPLQDGYAVIFNGPYFVYANVVNGSYSGALSHCGSVSSINVTVFDNNSTAQSVTASFPLNGNSIVVPTITLSCGLALNIYDGIYEATGTFSDITNSAFTGIYPKRYYLITAGPSSVIVKDTINGALDPGYLFNSGTSGTYYGNFGLQLSFDLQSNLITEIHNYYGDPNNPPTAIGDPSLGSGAPEYKAAPPRLRQALLDPSGMNNFEPLSRVIRVKYFMNDASAPSNPRSFFDETWTYIGPR